MAERFLWKIDVGKVMVAASAMTAALQEGVPMEEAVKEIIDRLGEPGES